MHVYGGSVTRAATVRSHEGKDVDQEIERQCWRKEKFLSATANCNAKEEHIYT